MSIWQGESRLQTINPLLKIKKDIKKVSRDLWILRKRKEFEYVEILNHFKLENMEQCIDCLNKLLYLLNREKSMRKRMKSKRGAKKAFEHDSLFFKNFPYDSTEKEYKNFIKSVHKKFIIV